MEFFSVPDKDGREVIYQQNTGYIYRMNVDCGDVDSIQWNLSFRSPREVNLHKQGEHIYHMFSSEGACILNFEVGAILPMPDVWMNEPNDIMQDVYKTLMAIDILRSKERVYSFLILPGICAVDL